MPYKFKSDKNVSRGYRDFNMTFNSNPNTRDFGAVKNENAIKQSVMNLVKTALGERPFQHNVGSRVNALLFEPYDVFTGEAIKDEIRSTLSRFERRISVRGVDVRDGYDNNQIEVKLTYTIIGEQIIKEVDFVLEKA